jgi:alpha-amylase/alpha-mannosidase (GH57 family)
MTKEEWLEILKDLKKVVEENPERTIFFEGRIHGAWQKLPVTEITDNTVKFPTGEWMDYDMGPAYTSEIIIRGGFKVEVPILI